MTREDLLREVGAYLAKYYIDLSQVHVHYSADVVEDVGEELQRPHKTFAQYLAEWLAKKEMLAVDVYKRAGIDRRLYSKIASVPDYHPGKNTVILLALAMEMTFEEAQEFLGEAGFVLTDTRKEDVVLAYFFEKRRYDRFEINEVLAYFHLPLLFH